MKPMKPVPKGLCFDCPLGASHLSDVGRMVTNNVITTYYYNIHLSLSMYIYIYTY